MNTKRITKGALLTMIAGTMLLQSCGADSAQPADATAETATNEAPAAAQGYAFEEITVTTPLNAAWVTGGKTIYEMKCQSCHKLTDEKLVGPGWKGITERRSPGWIVAMTTHPEEMLQQDPTAQKLLEEHLVKMPNQNVTADEARQLLEFMRSNDGVK